MFGFKKCVTDRDLLLAELDLFVAAQALLQERQPFIDALLRVVSRMDHAMIPPTERVIGLRPKNYARWLEYLDLLGRSAVLSGGDSSIPQRTILGVVFRPHLRTL